MSSNKNKPMPYFIAFFVLDTVHVCVSRIQCEIPQKKFTIGFAGRPSGTDFCINKVDNFIAHGLGGQLHHALTEEADPCFGDIVDGFSTLEKLFVLRIIAVILIKKWSASILLDIAIICILPVSNLRTYFLKKKYHLRKTIIIFSPNICCK